MIWRPQIKHFLKLASVCTGAILLTLLAGRQFELTHAPATWLHDSVARLPQLGPPDGETSGLTVVTIDVAAAHAPDFPWAQLRERILALEPARLGLSNLPDTAFPSWLEPDDQRLIFGVFAEQLPRIPALSHSARRTGLISPPLQEHGVVRWFDLDPPQSAAVPPRVDFLRLFGPQTASAQDRIKPGRYRIDFSLGKQIPVIEARRILRQGGLPQLFTGRTVLIGLAVGPGEAGFHTPLNVNAPSGMPLVELQAYMIASLQQGRLERALSTQAALLGLIAVVATTVALFVSLELLTAVILSLGMGIALTLAAWLALQFAQLWLPLFEGLLSLALAGLISAVQMWREQEKRLRAVTIDVMSRVQERLTPANVLASTRPWEVIIAFTREVFDAQSQVFLECLPDEPRVKAIAADRYDINSISEPRRDYRREPYISARAGGGVTALSRPFLRSNPDESQYLAPLEFAGELYGFWAFSVTNQTAQAFPRWKNIAQGVAFQVGELLYHQRAWQRKQGPGLGPAETSMPQRNLYRQLAQGALKLEQRVLRLEQANGQLTTGFVRYDLFGNLVQMNARAETLARDAGLRIYELTAFQFLGRLLGDDTVLARALMNRVVFERTTVSRPIAFPGLDDQAFYLHVHPLQRATPIELGGGLAPFDTEGILFELVTFSEVWELIGRRQTFATEQAGSILRQLAELQLAIALPAEADSGANTKLALMVEQLWSEARVLAGELAQLQPTADTTLVPTDIPRLLEDVLEELIDLSSQRAIRIDQPPLTSGSFVRSDPAQLKASLGTLFELLVNDAFEHSVIALALYCVPGTIRPSLILRLQTEGVGLPDELFQALLSGEPGEWDPRWEALRELGSQLEPINATVRGHSEVGEGVRLEIELALIAAPGMGIAREPA